MPIEFEHDRARSLLTVRMHGTVSGADLVAYAQHAVDDPEIDAATRDFIDLSGVTSVPIDSDGLRKFDSILQSGGRVENPGKMAIYAPTDLTFGMARMFQSYRDGTAIDVQVFRAEDEALAFLDLG